MARNKILTIEDLIKFCKSNKMYNFSSKESGKPIVVQSIQDFSSADVEESEDGKLYCKVRVCHTLLNRNKSFISEESMKQAMPTLKYSPLLAMIHQLDDGSWDFHAHDCHVETDEDGNEYIVYDEQQIGTFTADEPYFEYDEEMDKTYVVARVAIPEEYSRAADIVRAKNGTKVSCELIVYDCSYNAKEKYLQLDNFRFNGCTCLGSEKDGTPIGEGMLGSKLTLEDFSEENNSLIRFNEKLIEMQAKIEKLEACFSIDNLGKEETRVEIKDNFEEVAETEKVTDTEETTEEEVAATENESEVTVDETSGNETVEDEESEEVTDETEASDDDTDTEIKEDNACGGGGSGTKKKKKNNSENESEEPNTTIECSYIVKGEAKKFAVSLQEKIYAIQDLVNATYAEADNTYYGVSVYEDYVIMCDYWSGRYYKQSYLSEDDNYSLTGDRVEVYAEFVTADEQKELEEMRANYSLLETQLNEYKLAEVNAQKDALFVSDDYSSIVDKDEFKALAEDHAEYSVDELKAKLDSIILDYAKKGALEFSVKAPERKKINRVSFGMNTESSKPEDEFKPYGDLFDK